MPQALIAAPEVLGAAGAAEGAGAVAAEGGAAAGGAASGGGASGMLSRVGGMPKMGASHVGMGQVKNAVSGAMKGGQMAEGRVGMVSSYLNPRQFG